MASINKKTPREIVHTHGGAQTYEVKAEEKLYRTVMATLLWEDCHYESGESIADRIKALVPKVEPLRVAQIAIDARSLMKLRHVPLLIAREMARIDTHKHLVSKLLPEIIQRPDELTEFLAIYWKEKKQPISKQVKLGLAEAFKKFDEYALAKYNRDGAIKLRDILFLTYPMSDTKEQEELWKKLAEGTLTTPDTWEVALSAGKGTKKALWERLLTEKKLGALALIRNLRNMTMAGVDASLVKDALNKTKVDRVLPFRFLSAALHAPKFEPELEQALFRSLEGKDKLKGKTILIVDVSGSMYGTKVSEKSEMDRAKAACALAVVVRESCENPVIYATAGSDRDRVHETQLVPSRRGFALSDKIHDLCHPLGGGGIFLTQVMEYVHTQEKNADRIIVITDEQDCGISSADAPEKAKAFGTHNYIINVSNYEHGIGYGKWTKINGWSEAVLDYIKISEEGYKARDIPQNLYKQPGKLSEKPYAKKKPKSGTKKSNRNTGKDVQGNRTVRKKPKPRTLPV